MSAEFQTVLSLVIVAGALAYVSRQARRFYSRLKKSDAAACDGCSPSGEPRKERVRLEPIRRRRVTG